MNGIWNYSFLPNNLRVFSFQFFNNSLATGPRLAGRYRNDAAQNIDERCTFCLKGRIGVQMRETFLHLFFDCSFVQNCINTHISKYGENNWDRREKILFMFTGNCRGEGADQNKLNSLMNVIFFLQIWREKFQRRLPNYVTLEFNMLTIFDAALSLGKKIREAANECQSSVCRSWRYRHGRG